MPCYKCSNGKYKYGERGRCQFDTLSACEAAERAIHARENPKKKVLDTSKEFLEIKSDCRCKEPCENCEGCNKNHLSSIAQR